MGLSVWQIAIIAVVILVLFGRGKISEMMGDFGKGISSFKKGMNEDPETSSEQASSVPKGQISAPAADVVADTTDATKAADKTAS